SGLAACSTCWPSAALRSRAWPRRGRAAKTTLVRRGVPRVKCADLEGGLMRRLVLVLTLCSSIGCGKEVENGGDPDASVVVDGEKFSLTWGPVSVPPGTESTQCVWLRLGNTTEIKVNQMHNQLKAASHHLI